MANVVNNVNRKYVAVSNRVTTSYEKAFGLPCDLYFPVRHKYRTSVKYEDMNVFSPHQPYAYRAHPDVSKTLFYIPYLIKRQSMNSAELEFDAFYTAEEIDRPFIETSKKRELEIGTKVVVYQGNSTTNFFVDKKLVVTGADGHMLLRMFLAPLTEDACSCVDETEEQEESVINDLVMEIPEEE